MAYPQAPPGYSGPSSTTHKGYQSLPQEAGPSGSHGAGGGNRLSFEQGHEHEHHGDDGLLGLPREDGDTDPDDFKYGVTVEQSSPEIRQMFLKKVYSVLFCQLAGTAVVAALMSTHKVSSWLQQNQWALLISLVGSIVSMGFLFWKRHSHPTNLILLALFTLLESISIGAVVSYVDQVVVLQAVIITAFVFAGLTLFTLQSKYDFSSLAPYLFSGLLALVGVSFVTVFLPYSKTTDLVLAGAGCLIFSGYIVFDTYLISKRLSPDEWILANVSLYLDVVNLFISILRILNGTRDD